MLSRRVKTYGTKLAFRRPSNAVLSPQQRVHKDLLEFFNENVRRAPLDRVVSPVRSRANVINFPRVFSFIEAPDDAIATLREIADAVSSKSRHVVHLDQHDCEVIDYGAEAVACILSKAAAQAFSLGFRGRYPTDRDLRETVVATGLPKELGIVLPDLPSFTPFPLYHGKANLETASKSSEKERATFKFVEYVHRCLGKHSWGLNTEGKGYLAGLVSEVVGNAEDHADRDDWWIGGYMRLSKTGDVGDCHVVIFNFGRTIFESMKELSETSPLRKEIERLVRKHKRLNFFNRAYQEEQLWTLYALQQGVSRFKDGGTATLDRGQGTADMIRFFQLLGQTRQDGVDPKMCVVSGSTYILFDHEYKMRREQRDGEERSIIAFNQSNDLEKRPDPKSVRRLKNFFPGTLISLRFYLDQGHLDNLK